MQLNKIGISLIEKVGGFTDKDNEKYFSHRKNGDKNRHLAIITKKF